MSLSAPFFPSMAGTENKNAGFERRVWVWTLLFRVSRVRGVAPSPGQPWQRWGQELRLRKLLEKTPRRGLNDPQEISEASRTPSPPRRGAPTSPKGGASLPTRYQGQTSTRSLGLTPPSARLRSWKFKAERQGRNPGTRVPALPRGFGVGVCARGRIWDTWRRLPTLSAPSSSPQAWRGKSPAAESGGRVLPAGSRGGVGDLRS